MRTVIILLLLIWFAGLASAQPPDTLWTRSFGNEQGAYEPFLDVVSADTDGGFFIGGLCCRTMYHGDFYSRGYVARMDQSGLVMWGREIAGYYVGTEVYDLWPMPDGGVTAACAAGEGIWTITTGLIRYSAGGAALLNITYDNGPWPQSDTTIAIARTSDGGFALIGWPQIGWPPCSTQVLKVDSAGTELWRRSWPGRDLCTISALPDHGFLLAGGRGFSLCRLDSVGDSLWTRHVFADTMARCMRMTLSPTGTFLLVGSTGMDAHGEAVVVRNDGDTLWTRHYDFSLPIVAAVHCAEGGFILLSDRLIRIDMSGDTLWTQALPSANCLWKSVTQTTDSGVVVGGNALPYYDEIFLVKFAREGLSADPRVITHPASFALQAFPNPFNPTTTLSCSSSAPLGQLAQ